MKINGLPKRLMASAFSDSLMTSGMGMWIHPTEISKTTKGMTMKFLPDVGIYKEAQNFDTRPRSPKT